MQRPVAIYGAVLIVVGIVGYLLSGMVHVTALIPAVLGLVALGFSIGPAPRALPRGATIAGVVVAVLALFGTGGALAQLPQAFGGDDSVNAMAILARAVTAVASIALLLVLAAGWLRSRPTAGG